MANNLITIVSGLSDEIKDSDFGRKDMLSSRDIKNNDRRFNPINLNIATQRELTHREIQLKSFRNNASVMRPDELYNHADFKKRVDNKDASINS